MKLTDAIIEVKRIAKRSNYEGDLTATAIRECAEVYLASCDSEGTPKPRIYMRTGATHKPTNLTEMQWLLVRTPSFRSWFGNSVVVDENGDPKVMYHGTWKSFSEFKQSAIRLSKVAMTLWSGPGFYFTDNEKTARIYAGGPKDNIYDVFLRLENPLVVDETGNADVGEGISKSAAEKIFMDGDNTQWLDSGIANELVRMDVADGEKGLGKQFYKSLSRQQRVHLYVARLKTDVVKLKTAALAYGAKSQKKLLESICRHTGHDGVIHTITPDVKEWVVYDPKAIKSANKNDGEFSTAKAKVEDSVNNDKNNGRHNLEVKGKSDMVFKSLVDSLAKIVGTPAEDHAVAMDIVDRKGRHHQPKAIPEGGQYEEEGQYLHGQAKIDAAIRSAGSGKHASLLREHVAPLYAKLGNDSATRAKLQAMHEDIRGLDKKALLKGMAKHLKDMKRHAEAHNEIKDMGKEEFKAWLEAHPEYKTEMTERLLGKNMYNRHYDVKGGFHDDGTGKQKHEAWEEAKWSVGAKAMASMILFQEHADALHNAPDAIMANMIERASREEPQVENETGATTQIPQTEQITAGGNNDERASEVISDHIGELGNMESVQEAFRNNDENKIRMFAQNIGQEGLGALRNAVGENHPFYQKISEYIDPVGEPRDAAEAFANRVDSESGAGAPAFQRDGVTSGMTGNRQQFEERGEELMNDDLPRDVQNWADNLSDTNEEATFVASNGKQYRRSSSGRITEHELVSQGNHANAGNPRETYTDRDGNAHPIVHNDGGLKAPIHPSELAAVEAEKAKAFADARDGVEGAEEYAHALSRFLGRGNDARSPHPGMRQEGLLKHQLADKMQARLDEKRDIAVSAANEHGTQSEEYASAIRDYEATKKAVKTIAEKCGITPDMLPEGTDFNRVRNALGAPIRAANQDHQEAVNALHALANPEPAHEEQSESNTDTTATLPTSTQNATLEEMAHRDENWARSYMRSRFGRNVNATNVGGGVVMTYQNGDLFGDDFVEQLNRSGDLGNYHAALNDDHSRLLILPNQQGENNQQMQANLGTQTSQSQASLATENDPAQNASQEPTDADWQDAEQRLVAIAGPRNVHDVLSNMREQGWVSEANRGHLRNHLGADHPLTRWAEANPQPETTQAEPQTSNAPAQNAETGAQNGNELVQHLNDFINGETNRSRGSARLGRYCSNTQRIIDNLNRGDLSFVSYHTRDIYSHFRDANNPVVRQIREIRNNIARNLPAASDSAGHILMFDEANITPRYSVNRFNPTTAQQVTQRDVDNIIARMNGSASIHSYAVDESRRAVLGALDKQGLLSAFIRNPEMWNGRCNNADEIMRRLRSSRNPATKAYVRAFDALHPNFANRAEERQRVAEATFAMNRIAGHSTVTSQNTQAPEGSPLASVTDDQWRSAEQRVNSAMPGHEDIVSMAFGALRSGQVNSDVRRFESTIANILGSTDPVVRAINEHVSAYLIMEERTRRNFVNTRPSVPDDIKQANDQAMASFEKVRPGWQYNISQFGRASGHNCYMNDLYAMLHNLGYKVGYPPRRDREHTPRNTKAFFNVKKALLDGGAEPFVPNTREEIEGKLSEIARTRPNGTWLSIWSGGHNKSAVLQDGQWIFLDAYMGSNPRFATNEEIAGKVWPKDLVIRGSRRDGGLAGAVAQGLIDHNPTDEELAKIGGAMIIDPSKFRITQDLVRAMR